MERFRGTIALDIDGTITVEKHFLEKSVSSYLNELIEDRWLLVFVTGRTFSFARPLLSELKGSYFFAVQNGAALYEMPHERLIKKNYIRSSALKILDTVLSHEPSGLLVESGKENEDVCYYKPHNFTKEELEYVRFRISISPEKWIAVDSFYELDLSDFAVGKYFATKEKAEEIGNRIQFLSGNSFNIIVIRDPFRSGWHLAHINDKLATKGSVLSEITAIYPLKIAAGDDYNDIEMLKRAETKIVMENAPKPVLALADLVAAPATKQGIIPALKEALKKYGRHS